MHRINISPISNQFSGVCYEWQQLTVAKHCTHTFVLPKTLMSIQISNSTKISARDNVPEIYIITEFHPSHILSTNLSLLSMHISSSVGGVEYPKILDADWSIQIFF